MHNPPGAGTQTTEGGTLIDTKKNSANLRVNFFTPRLINVRVKNAQSPWSRTSNHRRWQTPKY